jgi:glycosyltransferase involved in cell wall biosynthesis
MFKVSDSTLETKAVPVVSICVVTYNHEKFIRQALDSFLMQMVDFKVEIIVHDDASLDQTQNILKEYDSNYPGIFNLLLQNENQRSKFGGGMNPRFNYPRSDGKYIALCDGDDYWTDVHKLQKQVDFLEASSKHVLVYHPWQVLEQESNDLQSRLYGGPRTLTLLFRNQLSGFTFEGINVLNGDTLLKFYLSTKGEFMCLNDIKPAIHRHHLGGVWSKKDDFFQVSNKLHTIETIVGLYKGTEFLDKARFQHVSTLMGLNETKSDTLKEYVIKQSFSGFNSYLRFHGILWIFQKQKLKRFLRVSYESLKRRKHS